MNVILSSRCTYIDRSENLKRKQKIFHFEIKIMITKYTHKHFLTMDHHINLNPLLSTQKDYGQYVKNIIW
jgi:hypothetical protein